MALSTAAFPGDEFSKNVQSGKLGESRIAGVLRNRGYTILPAYDTEIDSGKGPRLFMATGSAKAQLIAPDMLAMKDGKFMWVEAKHKSHFTWYGNGHCWQTGVNLRHYQDYLEVQRSTGMQVWLMFLHSDSRTWPKDIERWGAPPTCPTGLFGNTIDILDKQKRISEKGGTSGMVYFSIHNLIKINVAAGI